VDVAIPHGKFTVITGVSGSGKSSLAFDTIFAEGQRRYVECLSTYARRFLGRLERAPVDSVEGLAPAIAIDQRSAGSSPRSTVATVTELHDHFRLLWANLGVPHCPECGREVRALGPSEAASWLADAAPGPGRLIAALHPPRPAATLRAEGWARGWSGEAEVELEGDSPISHLVIDRVNPATVERARLAEAIQSAYGLGGRKAWFYPLAGGAVPVSERSACPEHGPVLGMGLTPRHFSFNHWLGACKACDGLGRVNVRGAPETCPTCRGGRLQRDLLAVRFLGRGIAEVAGWTVSDARRWFDGLALEPTAARIADQPLREIRARLGFLENVGLGYLTLDRGADTLSGGESQRIRLASQLGAGLCGVIYVLDEPTVGLHARDTARLLDTLLGLRDLGNTLIVVEHDPETIRRADHVIDLGPGAGEMGGLVVAAGPPESLGAGSVTGPWLSGERSLAPRLPRRVGGPPWELRGLTLRSIRKL
jgi:excinuclease ABC subunit A